MKGMIEIKRIGGKGINVLPTEISGMQSHRKMAVMQHTISRCSDISPCTHKISENMTIKTNSDINIMLKDDQDNIQTNESTCPTKWYTVVSVCMWGDQNNHGKIRINTLSNAIRSIINNPACQKLKWIRPLSMHQEIPNVQSRDEHPLIVQSNATFTSL